MLGVCVDSSIQVTSYIVLQASFRPVRFHPESIGIKVTLYHAWVSDKRRSKIKILKSVTQVRKMNLNFSVFTVLTCKCIFFCLHL